jgi:hypothetical protein
MLACLKRCLLLPASGLAIGALLLELRVPVYTFWDENVHLCLLSYMSLLLACLQPWMKSVCTYALLVVLCLGIAVRCCLVCV